MRQFWAGQLLVSITLLALAALALAQATNPIVTENAKQGTSAWRLTNPAMNGEIEGYSSSPSVAHSQTLWFYVSTAERTFTAEIFRLGYYGGAGARSVQASSTYTTFKQANFVNLDPAVGLLSCPWVRTFSVTIPNGWVSGYFIVKLTSKPSGKQTYIPFTLRDDYRRAQYFIMSSSHTYLAYNDYGGKSAYDFNSNNARSYKVTYDRPYATTIGVIPGSRNVSTDYGVGSSFILGPRAGWEYAFVRFVEQEGYDVMYFDNQDLHNGYAIAPPRFRTGIIVGHDEYWSNEMRNAVEAARNQGLSLAFFAANVCFWKVRFEQSPTSGQANRVMVIYRDADKDPYFNTANSNMVTTRWRWDPNPRPENMLLGVMYNYDPVVDQPLVVADGLHWMFKGTSLRTGSSIPGLLGYEVDETLGSTLPNLRVVFESPYTINETQLVRNSHGVMSRMPNGAFTFATGSIQWAWGLDNDLVTPKERRLYMNDDIKQITRNILAVFADPPAPGLEPLMSAYNVVANDCPSATGGLVLNTFSSGSLVANDLGRAMNDDGTMSASVAGGRLSLTSTANGYWYSMLGNSGGTCFDGSLYNALTLTVRAPPGTDFQIQLQSRDSSCMNTVTSIVSAAQYAQTQGGWSASADRRFIIPFGAFPNLAPGKLTALVLAKVTPVGATVSIDDVMLTSCASMGESGPISQPPVDNPPRVCSSSALAVDTFANANMEMNDLGLYTSDDDTMTAMSLSSGQLRLTAPDPGAYWYTLLANANQCRDMSSYAAIQFSIQAPVGTKLILQLQFRNDRCKGWEGSSELQLAGFTGAQQTIRVPFTDFDTAVPASRLFAVSVFGLSGSPAPISISLDDLVFAC